MQISLLGESQDEEGNGGEEALVDRIRGKTKRHAFAIRCLGGGTLRE